MQHITLYDAAWAPSPRRVRIYLHEKGLTVERIAIDLRGDNQLKESYLAINPRGLVPALGLETGEVIDDSVAICRYFEALYPEPPLFGTTPLEIARIDSWSRRIESDAYAAVVYALRNTRPNFVDRGVPGKWPPIKQLPELAERARIMWGAFMAPLDARLENNPWVAGEAFSFADIMGLVTLDFAAAARLEVPQSCTNVLRWHTALRARASAAA